MVSAKAIDLIAHQIESCKKSYDVIEAESTVSKSTLSRIVNKHAASRPVLDILAAYFEVGEEYAKLVDSDGHSCAFASELVEELQSLRSYYETKAVSVRQHYESQINALKEQSTLQAAARDKERETQQKMYATNLSHLKEEIAKSDRIIAARGKIIAALVLIIIGLLIAFIVALLSDSVLR